MIRLLVDLGALSHPLYRKSDCKSIILWDDMNKSVDEFENDEVGLLTQFIKVYGYDEGCVGTVYDVTYDNGYVTFIGGEPIAKLNKKFMVYRSKMSKELHSSLFTSSRLAMAHGISSVITDSGKLLYTERKRYELKASIVLGNYCNYVYCGALNQLHGDLCFKLDDRVEYLDKYAFMSYAGMKDPSITIDCSALTNKDVLAVVKSLVSVGEGSVKAVW